MSKSKDAKISIIIPCLGGIEYIDRLFGALNDQTFVDFEIIFINSQCENSSEIEEKVLEYSRLDLKVFSTIPLCPGDARNLGVLKSNTNMIAFLDIKTIPRNDWLQKIIEFRTLSNCDIVLGKFICKSEIKFQELVQAVTFGNNPSDSLPGSLLSRELFNDIGDFIHEARSGEDEEWLERIRNSKYRIGKMDHATLSYLGLPKSIVDLIKKWFFYSIKSAPINVANSQKGAYFFLMFLLLLYFFFNWNYIFTNDRWDQSPYFFPHINKIAWSVFFLIYVTFRGIFFPLTKGVSKGFLFPMNWFKLSIVGLLIDLSKFPGRILGYLFFLKVKLIK